MDRCQREGARRAGDRDYERIYIYPNFHAVYYPGAKPIALKVLFRKSDGRLLGAQAVGEDGVDKRISTLAMAIQMGATVYDLEEAELCYTPPFGSAKDPVNFAGMVAAGVVQSNLSWHSSGRFPTTACSALTVMSWRRSWDSTRWALCVSIRAAAIRGLCGCSCARLMFSRSSR